jgi:hypothetical protein
MGIELHRPSALVLCRRFPSKQCLALQELLVVSLLHPGNAIAILRRATWQPDAERWYEVMSASFWRTDELVNKVADLCAPRGNWAFRFLMGYRGSLIRGEPDDRLKSVWDQVARECPNWPGLRPERNCVSLANELRRKERRRCIEFERLDRELTRKSETPNE